jgi:hypothetical protein
MNKLIISVALIALASTAMVGSAAAKPGKPGGGAMIGNQSPGININIQNPGSQPGKGGKSYGGDATSPGDAFYPDTAEVCEGTIKYQFDDNGNLLPICLF